MIDTRAHRPLVDPSEVVLDELSTADLRDQGERWRRLGRSHESRAYAEALATRTPDDPQALLLAARDAAADPEAHAAADRWFQLAERVAPLEFEDIQTWVAVLLRAGPETAARRALTRLVTGFPDDPRALVLAAEGYSLQGDNTGAWRLASSALRHLPAGGQLPGDRASDRSTADLLGRIHRVATKCWVPDDEVLGHLVRLAEQGQECLLASADLLLLADVSAQSAQTGCVAEHVLKVLAGASEDSTDPRVWMLRARAHINQGDYVAATRIYDRFSPQGFDDMYNQAFSLVTVGRPHDAQIALAATCAEFETRRGELDESVSMEMQIWLELAAAVLAELNHDYLRKWESIRKAVDLSAELGENALPTTLRMTLLTMKLWLAPSWEARDQVLDNMVALAMEAPDNYELATTLAESLMWAGQVEPPGELSDESPDSDHRTQRLAQLRTRAELIARSSLARRAHQSHSEQDDDEGRDDRVWRTRLALLVGDRLMADALLPEPDASVAALGKFAPGGAARQEEHLRARVLLECGEPQKAFEQMESVMKVWRQDLNARLFFVHVARASEKYETAAREATACAATAVDNPIARLLAAECLFDLALAKTPAGAAKQQILPDSEIHDNLQQLLRVVTEYRHALEAHLALARWLSETQAVSNARNLASDLLPATAVEEICRQALHASVLAGEGMERLRLTSDAMLEKHVEFFVDQLRRHQRSGTSVGGSKLSGWSAARKLPRRCHDEAARLQGLFTTDRRARRASWRNRLLYAFFGLALIVSAPRWTGSDEVQLAVTLVGFAIGLAPLFTSLNLAGFQVAPQAEETFAPRRSHVLRSAPVFRFEQIALSDLPPLPPSAQTGPKPRTTQDEVVRQPPNDVQVKATGQGAQGQTLVNTRESEL